MLITPAVATPDDQLRILENGSDLVVEKTCPPKQRWAQCERLHLHPHQDEHFEILAGMLSARVAGEERTYVVGEAFKISRGVPHRVCNQGRKPARIRWKVRPAMDTAVFLKAVYGLSTDGRIQGLLQQAVIAWAFRDIYKSLSPPLWVQPLIIAPLAMVGRLLGYKA